jgi:hypothetical protein
MTCVVRGGQWQDTRRAICSQAGDLGSDLIRLNCETQNEPPNRQVSQCAESLSADFTHNSHSCTTHTEKSYLRRLDVQTFKH